MTVNPPARLLRLADAVLMPCFDGVTAPDWVRRRVGASMGGVCLFARNVDSVDQLAALSAQLVSERESVVIAIDEEAGDVTRLDAATGSRFPGAAALGYVDDVAATEQIAGQVGALLREAGVSLNLAPCADVALDPMNPVIGVRSFGGDPQLVARHITAWVTGQQRAGVAACAKHYPGHGDTDADTHQASAIVHGDLDELHRTALPPFIAAIAAGCAAVMPGHLLVPGVDDLPASVSPRWLTGILRGELGFTGAIVSDALEMAAVAGPYGIPGGAVRALVAGADLLCIGGQTRPEEEIEGIAAAIAIAVVAGELSEERLTDAAERASRVGIAAALAGASQAGEGGAPGNTSAVTSRRDGGAEDMTEPPGEQTEARETLHISGPAIDTVSAAVAARAIEVAGDLPTLADPVIVVRCEDSPNIAVGMIPWGPAALLGSAASEEVVHGSRELTAELLGPLGVAGTVLVVTRDKHRHPWMTDVLARVRAARTDAILVEMGTSGVAPAEAPALASYGATLANSDAIVDRLRS